MIAGIAVASSLLISAISMLSQSPKWFKYMVRSMRLLPLLHTSTMVSHFSPISFLQSSMRICERLWSSSFLIITTASGCRHLSSLPAHCGSFPETRGASKAFCYFHLFVVSSVWQGLRKMLRYKEYECALLIFRLLP